MNSTKLLPLNSCCLKLGDLGLRLVYAYFSIKRINHKIDNVFSRQYECIISFNFQDEAAYHEYILSPSDTSFLAVRPIEDSQFSFCLKLFEYLNYCSNSFLDVALY